jgi:hypothetical protein
MNTRKILSIAFLFCCALALASCTRATDAPPQFTYPLDVGNRWEYNYSFAVRDQSTNVVVRNASARTAVEVIRIESLPNVQNAAVLTDQEISSPLNIVIPVTGLSYFKNEADGLYFYGYRGYGSSAMPSRANDDALPFKLAFKGREFSSFNALRLFVEQSYVPASPAGIADTTRPLFLENPPAKSLSYPTDASTQWVMRASLLRIEKKYVGNEQITVPAGIFNCRKVDWFHDRDGGGNFDEDIKIIDYIAPEGLIRRTTVMKNINGRDAQGNDLGKFSTTSEYVLTSVRVR